MKFLAFFLGLALLVGCSTSKGLRGKPGSARGATSTGATSELVQPENPKDGARSNVRSVVTEKTVLPGGTIKTEESVISRDLPDGSRETTATTNTTTIPEDKTAITEKTTEEEASNIVGGAQKDTVGDTVAKLKSANTFYYIGGALILIGLACSFVPYLRALLGSTQFGIFLAIGGTAVMILPLLVIGNEMLILIGGAAILGPIAYLHFNRSGQKEGENKALREFIDLNKNGIDDREEK